jgi:hypothetical protein
LESPLCESEQVIVPKIVNKHIIEYIITLRAAYRAAYFPNVKQKIACPFQKRRDKAIFCKSMLIALNQI